MKLRLLRTSDAEQLLEFELENRDWFEQSIGPRPEAFYSEKGVQAHIADFLAEYELNRRLPFLLTSNSDNILGRINLSAIDLDKGYASLGYRVGQQFVGQGLAKTAVRDALQIASDFGIGRLTAVVTELNEASMKVLQRNGFEAVGRLKQHAVVKGQPLDCVEYRWYRAAFHGGLFAHRARRSFETPSTSRIHQISAPFTHKIQVQEDRRIQCNALSANACVVL